MEIYKRPQRILMFLFILLIGCNSSETKVNEELEAEKIEISKQAKRQQKLLENWFNDFQIVQKEIFLINTNELLLLELELESPKKQKTDKERIIEKIKKIKKYYLK